MVPDSPLLLRSKLLNHSNRKNHNGMNDGDHHHHQHNDHNHHNRHNDSDHHNTATTSPNTADPRILVSANECNTYRMFSSPAQFAPYHGSRPPALLPQGCDSIRSHPLGLYQFTPDSVHQQCQAPRRHDSVRATRAVAPLVYWKSSITAKNSTAMHESRLEIMPALSVVPGGHDDGTNPHCDADTSISTMGSCLRWQAHPVAS
jgi:hypothetical protein